MPAQRGSPPRTGVYFCAGDEPLSTEDLDLLASHVDELPGVALVRRCEARPDPQALAAEIRAQALDAVVLAGAMPGYLKPAFARAMALADRNADNVRLAPFRDHAARHERFLERALLELTCAVHGVPSGLVARAEEAPAHPTTLVIGGGVAGIQAALEIAEAGKPVVLVERSPTLGGHMAMFDKTFPTLDCAACILTPKMVALGQHPGIELLTCSEVCSVAGEPGAFRVQILKRARRVDPNACVACEDCARYCPVSVPSEFDSGITTRKAIYRPFPQAVPPAFLVDAEACTWLKTGGKKCGACLHKCAKNAIHLEARDETVEIEVGNIIVATGYDVFDARRIARYGYGRYPNVLTALEFERLTNAAGPTGGRIVTRIRRLNKRTRAEEWIFEADGPPPRRLAIVHCVGSRDEHYNRYCSRVCCMYSLKFAHLVREKLPGAECYEFYIDMRAFGKGYEAFFERIREEGVHIVRGRSARVTEEHGQLVVKGEDIVGDRVLEFPVDMVLLAVGLEPARGAQSLAELLGIARDADGWFREADYNADPTGTDRPGIYLAGVCQGPKDIPDTVAQASAVAARVLKTIASGVGRERPARSSLEDVRGQARQLASRLAEGRTGWQSASIPA
jgi:heterodisulfide reductase subunit A